jgi:hypothetical protein
MVFGGDSEIFDIFDEIVEEPAIVKLVDQDMVISRLGLGVNR